MSKSSSLRARTLRRSLFVSVTRTGWTEGSKLAASVREPCSLIRSGSSRSALETPGYVAAAAAERHTVLRDVSTSIKHTSARPFSGLEKLWANLWSVCCSSRVEDAHNAASSTNPQATLRLEPAAGVTVAGESAGKIA